ncbi:TetR/AcrR family transcriptional regulator [Mycobacterium sp. ITM-2016-00318]|uniref:TetR/AcrR family transcriptional regulator n=1 Tax=Mycobacterium sp. ITM-2016-00318 TaxID=2099693 RepID=UPI00287F5B46|nr:TetR/AcrR family transcriptional regulator [Mycobacterium sp. ITM-2016-00318]WNG93622.1 TetR/AcrR family transcriptional regulator [Mycobacterium sp. ITM-2016-00318]
MARPPLHDTDAMLDAARGLLLQHGGRAATIEAIAEASGAPVGSIYHRFGSLEVLVTRLWMRAVQRSQASFLAVMDTPDATEAAVAAALSIFDFCTQHPADARLLASFGREELIGATPAGPLAGELAQLNRPVQRAVKEMAERLYGTRSRRAFDRTMLAVFDLPYGATKRYLVSGAKLPAGLRDDAETAVRAVIDAPL